MIVSFLTTKTPALSSGSEVRNFYLLEALLNSKIIEKVNLIYIPVGQSSSPQLPQHAKIKIHKLQLHNRSFLKTLKAFITGKIPYVEHLKDHDHYNKLEQLVSEADLFFISELDGYFTMENFLKRDKPSIPIFLDCHNVDYLRFLSEIRSASIFKKILGLGLTKRLKKSEINAILNVDHILTCSEIDKKYFLRYLSTDKITVIPNGVHIEKHTQNEIEKNSIFFMGLLSYYPNDDGLKYYLKKIHPLVLEQIPNAKVIIVGKGTPKWLQNLAKTNKSIKILGFVKNVSEHIQKAEVCICPLRQGSGTRLKILEYLAKAKAVVSTSIGCEGIELINQKHLLIADTPKRFSSSIVQLLNHPESSRKIGLNGYNLVSKKYNWESIGKELVKIIENFNG